MAPTLDDLAFGTATEDDPPWDVATIERLTVELHRRWHDIAAGPGPPLTKTRALFSHLPTSILEWSASMVKRVFLLERYKVERLRLHAHARAISHCRRELEAVADLMQTIQRALEEEVNGGYAYVTVTEMYELY